MWLAEFHYVGIASIFTQNISTFESKDYQRCCEKRAGGAGHLSRCVNIFSPSFIGHFSAINIFDWNSSTCNMKV